MKIGLADFPPFLLAGIRFLSAGCILYPFLRVQGIEPPTRRQWGGATLVGALLLVGGNGGVIFAEQWVASSLAALGLAAIPLWAAVFSGLFGRWPSRMEWFGLGLGFLGVICLNLENDLHGNLIGGIVLIFAAISWAFGSIWSQRLPLPKGIMSSAAQMLAGGALLVLLGLVTGERITVFPGRGPLLALLFLIVGGSLLAFCAYGYLLSRVRPALATSYAYVNPLVAVGLGIGFAGEKITTLGVVAMLTILSGVVLVSLGKQRK